MAKCIGCGLRPDRVIRTGVTEPGHRGQLTRQATTAGEAFTRPMAAGPQAVFTRAAAPASRVQTAAGRKAVKKLVAVVQQIARKFAAGQPAKIATAQGPMYVRPGRSPGGIVGQLVSAATTVAQGRPVVLSTAAGVATIQPGRQAIFQKMPQKDVGYLRGRVAAAPAEAGTRAVPVTNAIQGPDKRGGGVFQRMLSTFPKGTAMQAGRTAPAPFARSAYQTPYQSPAMRRRTF